MLRRRIASSLVCVGALVLVGCGHSEPQPYPAQARTTFQATCPANDPVCACTWDRITRTLSYEDYESALDRYREEGLMDPRITRARTHCLEHHRNDRPTAS